MTDDLTGKGILLIDDDKDILTLETIFLSREGFNVESAETGAEAIEKSQKKHFNCALIDIVLPDMHGTRLIKELSNGPPVKMRKIMVTGHATLDNAIDALNFGAHAYVEKPIKHEDLLLVVKDQLGKQMEEYILTMNRVAGFMNRNKADFVKIVTKSLNSFWGEQTTKSAILQLGDEEATRDPKIFADKLRSFSDSGAETILIEMLKTLEGSKKNQDPT